ncbi:MAG: hypothetical protein EZS26_003492 [Candidatus Ordinivivax streblomastigis]|uniref:DUF1565 domain-containing protein n=1 Tax=Candidatus Ordinivivax streblomastigis TaxID=2540710 RepID=A0A5M8NVI3_9BACT|nr:MAG: hypothetical protein EZS26_003492 [Candidatus Ordinivivax streblomastigis]
MCNTTQWISGAKTSKKSRCGNFRYLVSLFVSCMYLTPVIHAGTLYVSKSGNDANPGTKRAPFLTINKAAQVAVAGDIVLVAEGVYRETVKPKNSGTDEAHRITYKTKKGAKVVVKGSEEINEWVQHSGNVWRVSLPNMFFGDYNPYTTLHPHWASDYFPDYSCGDVYLNEEAYFQKTSVITVQNTAKTWYAEQSGENTVIYANFGTYNPNMELAEINVRQQVFAPDIWGLRYITVDGFTMMHAANRYSDYPTAPEHRQAGAVSVYGGLKWIIQNNTVINARSIGIDIGLGCGDWGCFSSIVKTQYYNTDQYGSHIVRNNYIAKCGQSGIVGILSWNSQILNNRIEDTNYRDEFAGDETAAIKIHLGNTGLIKGNYIKTAKGHNTAGIWMDWGNQAVRITGNIIIDCPWSVYTEATFGPILVDNNVFIHNRYIRTSNATGIVYAHNLIADDDTITCDGDDRVTSYFKPGTMTISSATVWPQTFSWYNNLMLGLSFPDGKDGRTHIQEGNSTTAITNFSYQANSQEVIVSFDYNAGGSTNLAPVTKERVGVIPLANESIPTNVNTDFFGKPIVEENVTAGPFQNIKNGSNTLKIRLPTEKKEEKHN